MDKPTTLSIRNFLIRKLAVDIMVPESVIESVIIHQFSTIYGALPNNDSIEISGFGKLIFRKQTALKRLAQFNKKKTLYISYLEDETIGTIKRRNLTLRLNSIQNTINDLKTKLHED